jgi:dynein heavy chain
MDLVLFEYAIYNLIKITRAIKLEQGNIVFIGLGGSGRNSLSRFAIYLREYELLELEMNQNYSKDLWK